MRTAPKIEGEEPWTAAQRPSQMVPIEQGNYPKMLANRDLERKPRRPFQVSRGPRADPHGSVAGTPRWNPYSPQTARPGHSSSSLTPDPEARRPVHPWRNDVARSRSDSTQRANPRPSKPRDAGTFRIGNWIRIRHVGPKIVETSVTFRRDEQDPLRGTEIGLGTERSDAASLLPPREACRASKASGTLGRTTTHPTSGNRSANVAILRRLPPAKTPIRYPRSTKVYEPKPHVSLLSRIRKILVRFFDSMIDVSYAFLDSHVLGPGPG